MKKVSIIVPVYNLQDSIRACVISILNQTYKELEIILIDDGSTDNSLELCYNLAQKDDRICVLHHKNHGVSYTRNRGISVSTGEYLMFIDGDDQIEQDMVCRYVEVAESSGADVVIGGIRFVEPGKTEKSLFPPGEGVYGVEIWNIICRENSGVFGYVANKLYLTKLIRQYQIHFDLERCAQEDLDFALSAYFVSRTFYLLPYAGYQYNYCPTRKQHPYEQYIANKIKMLRCAETVTNLDYNSRYQVIKGVEGLLYVALYESTTKNFSATVTEYRNIDGLCDILSKEQTLTWVTKLFMRNACGVLQLYFAIRKFVSRMIHGN